jgi:hypothetical protein
MPPDRASTLEAGPYNTCESCEYYLTNSLSVRAERYHTCLFSVSRQSPRFLPIKCERRGYRWQQSNKIAHPILNLVPNG